MRGSVWRGIGALALVSLLLAVGVRVLVPHVYLLWFEGFPEPEWPAAGQFETVAGVSNSPPLNPLGTVPDAAMARFSETSGRALLVERGGQLQAAAFGPGVSETSLFNSYSLVKSLVGVLTLRALADGRIASLDNPLRVYLGPTAPDVSLKDVLLMRSGLLSDGEPAKSMDDGAFSPFGPLAELHAFGVEHSMPKLAVDADVIGTFRYQSVNTALLGAVLEVVYAEPLPDLLSRLIWVPAGAEPAHWRKYPAGRGVSAYCCLYARPVDWMRVARYLLDNGTSLDPFLPDDLWLEWIMPKLPPEARRAGAYGLHLRHDILDRDGAALTGPFAYFFGHQGQLIYLMSDADIIVVRFGETMPLLHSTLYELFPDG